ncbi:AzlC family ABC transporter permease [Millisia brevis]|uniref:AzlC family ABC transporter permease n=1 Tax=Millisia brevis TaxID=264148 RepID=UPI000A077F0D|nr:AzlC family ABC transporter permease [Millisia brevis]
MRSIWRTIDRQTGREVLLVCVAVCLVGASFGAIAVGAGLPVWIPMLMSVVVFAGGCQFMFVGILAAAGGPWTAVAAGLLVNLRHVPFGFALGDTLGGSLRSRLLGSFPMTDESVAFALAQRDPATRRAVYLACGAGLFVFWNIGTVAGALLAGVIPDPNLLGLDAVFPAVVLALVLPSLRDTSVALAAVVGGALAVACTPFVPAGLSILLAAAAVPLAALGRKPVTGGSGGSGGSDESGDEYLEAAR